MMLVFMIGQNMIPTRNVFIHHMATMMTENSSDLAKQEKDYIFIYLSIFLYTLIIIFHILSRIKINSMIS